MSIRRLSQDVVDKIKSSSSITSLNGVVCGLVKNSLDARAKKISIVVDYSRGNCTVEDDGEGIAAEEFGIDGGLAKLHSTSRFPPSQHCHGRHGNFLASLAVLSLLKIVSKHPLAGSLCSLSIHHGATLSRDAAARTGERLEAFSHGTRVAVFDLFGSMPVRVKHRATLFSSASDVDKEIKKLAYEVTALLLAWPTPVFVSLREAKTRRELRLKCPDGLKIAQRTSRLFTQVGLADSSEVDSWIPISASNGRVSLEGCISTIPAATRKAQIISLGVQPMQNSLEGNVLFEEVNEIFTSSSFGFVENLNSNTDSTQAARPKPSKGLEKWPMFYLKFQSHEMADLTAEELLAHRNSSLTAIISLLRAVCYAFLKKHKMRPRKLANRQKSSASETEPQWSPSAQLPADKSTLGVSSGRSSPFDNWRRVKVGYRTGTSDAAQMGPQRLIGPGGKLLRRPFAEESCEDIQAVDELCRHFDTNSGSGNIITSGKTSGFETLQKGTGWWLDSVLQSWKNPVFETVEPALPYLQTESGFVAEKDGNKPAGSTGTNISARVSKAGLKKAAVIAQVDNKFVLINVPLESCIESGTSPSHALFLVDQHAADERCRLEELMAGYFEDGVNEAKPVVETLDVPIHFDLSARELEIFACHKKFMAKWGLVYQLVDPVSSLRQKRAPGKVMVSGLPPSILERCRGEPRVLINLLRSELWKLDETPGLACDGAAPDSSFRGCPRGLLELLHSRACRSAIMFNDELTLAECSALVGRLAQTSLPFQCAHGRPSMVPLVDLGKGASAGILGSASRARVEDSSKRPVMSSAGAWKSWLV